MTPTVSRRVVLLATTMALAGCARPQQQVAPPEPPVVTVEHPVESNQAAYKEFTGRLAAVETVEVRARVNGYLTRAAFKEGALVKKGDLLYQIDARPYQAALNKADGDVGNWESQLARANADLARARSTSGGVTSREELDRFTAQKLAAESGLKSAQAARDTAKLDLDFTRITSPIAGRVSRTLITEGNLIAASESLLTRVTTVSPIYAYWDIDENTSLWYRDQIFRLKTIPDPRGDRHLKCRVKLRNDDKFTREGDVDFIEHQIERATGTRLIRGRLDNPDGYMGPGDSVIVRVDAGPEQKVITVPEVAVGSQQKQKYVLVVNDKDEAEMRPVKLGEVRDGRQIVTEGVTPRDRVIVNGLLRAKPGAKVNPKPAGQTQTAMAAPAK